MSRHPKMQLQFKFGDNTSIDYDYNLIYSINPKIIITKSIIDDSGKYILKLPEKIKKDDLVDFLFLYIKNNKPEDNINFFNESRNKFISIINDKKKLENFLEILLFFNNESYTNLLINNIFIPEFKKDKIIDFILFSYKLIERSKKNKLEISGSYLNLYNICLDKIQNDEKYLINNYDSLKFLGKKILRDVLDKIFYNLLYSNCLLNTDEESQDDSLDVDSDNNDSNINENNSILNENNNIRNNRTGDSEEYIGKSFCTIKKENNYILNIKDYRELINILMDLDNNHNIYELLSYEYINILSNESNYDLNTSFNKKNTFQKKIYFNNIKNNNLIYEEFPLDIILNNKTVYLIIFFQPFEKSINVCIKIKDNKINLDNKLFQHLDDRDYCFKLFTFYTSVQITKNNNYFTTKKHNTIISLTNNKSMYNIFKSSFKTNNANCNDLNNIFNNNIDQYFTLKVEIKLCYIYTGIISYLLQDFNLFYNDEHLNKLSKHVFILIINNKFLDKMNSDDIINSILLWLNDDVNIKEDISEIFYNINWNNVDDSLIFELIVKYSHFIINNESLRIMFCKIFEEKYKDFPDVKILINNIILASKKIKYDQVFTQMKRNVKFNNAFINYNSFMVMNNNKITNDKEAKDDIEENINSKNKIIKVNNIRKNKSNDYKFIERNKKINKNIKNYNSNNLTKINNNKNNNINDKNKVNKNNLIINYTSPSPIRTNKTGINIINIKKMGLEKPIKPDIKILKNKTKQEIKNNMSMKKINKSNIIKKINNKSFDKNKIETNLTKKSLNEFKRITFNRTYNIFPNNNNNKNSINNKFKKNK